MLEQDMDVKQIAHCAVNSLNNERSAHLRGSQLRTRFMIALDECANECTAGRSAPALQAVLEALSAACRTDISDLLNNQNLSIANIEALISKL